MCCPIPQPLDKFTFTYVEWVLYFNVVILLRDLFGYIAGLTYLDFKGRVSTQ